MKPGLLTGFLFRSTFLRIARWGLVLCNYTGGTVTPIFALAAFKLAAVSSILDTNYLLSLAFEDRVAAYKFEVCIL